MEVWKFYVPAYAVICWIYFLHFFSLFYLYQNVIIIILFLFRNLTNKITAYTIIINFLIKCYIWFLLYFVIILITLSLIVNFNGIHFLYVCSLLLLFYCFKRGKLHHFNIFTNIITWICSVTHLDTTYDCYFIFFIAVKSHRKVPFTHT